MSALDESAVAVDGERREAGHWLAQATVERWSEQEYAAALAYYEDHPQLRLTDGPLDGDEIRAAVGDCADTITMPYNALLTAGITRMLNLLIAAGGQGMDAAHCRIGTGNGSTAVVIGDTDLSAAAGSGNRWFQLCSSVSVSTNVLTVVATFATGDGNYVWSEWGIDFGTSSSNAVTAPLLNRKVASLGTKASGAPWTLTVTITVS